MFEQHVCATFLALLLVRGIPPVLADCSVVEVHLQTEHLGWATDDVLVAGLTGGGTRRQLICQVKRSFTVSHSDEDCCDTLVDFWTDFRTQASFSPEHDRFAIVTLRGTNTFLGQFAELLDCARTSRDPADFEHRLSTPGFVNAGVARYFKEVYRILNEHEKRDLSVADVWPFLKVIHAISFDLTTATRQTETQIKTLLAHTASDPDPVSTAGVTWAELLREVGENAFHATSYVRENLPAYLRERHSPITDSSQTALRVLSEHSSIILNGIRTTIGQTVHLDREQLVQCLLSKLVESQIVIVTGSAGSGKSGITKTAIELLSDCFVFCFRAEEFAAAHLDETLQRSQIPMNAVTLGALMAGQPRKVLLVESVERLLESSTRDAFTDMLGLLKRDHSWKLILTCRDYSSDLVRSSLLQFGGVEHSVLEMPVLNDDELDTVAASLPNLSSPLSTNHLRELLRTPYLLDKASQMAWPTDRPLPQDERAFRAKFWAEIVRSEDRPAGDMPRKRHDAFVAIALRRARALTQYVSRLDIDAGAIHALRRDSIVAVSQSTDLFVAPAHDVLEDWAILSWIDEQYQLCEHSIPDLAIALGTYPAVRRTYRKWLAEFLERDSDSADALFDSVIGESSLSPQFRDDTLVSLIKSPLVGELLQRKSGSLLANDHRMLKRIIHLLRVGCVTTPAWFGGIGAAASIMQVPDGAAWASVLELVATHLHLFGDGDRSLLLGLCEDAARGVTLQTPYPDGSDSISAIAYWLLSHFEKYRDRDERERVLKVIAKIPKCDPEKFIVLIMGNGGSERRDRSTAEFRGIVLWDVHSCQACRDIPDCVIAALREELILSVDDLRALFAHGSGIEIEPGFGIRKRATHYCSPASAYQGPFLNLFRYHTKHALAFVLSLLNHSADWYLAQRVPIRYVEAPVEVTLTLNNGAVKKQACNSRLWNLYRGTSVGPDVLQSVLMALEQWLLDVGDERPEDLDGHLSYILQNSSNAATSAVVAGVATAFPSIASETILSLLTTRDFILLDRARMAAESHAVVIGDMMPFGNSTRQFYDDERRSSNALEHRRYDFESAVANAQLGAARTQIHQLLDEHRERLPPIEKQTEVDRLWRLALHRMDLRQYAVSAVQPEQDSSGSEFKTVRLDLVTPEPDLQQMVNDAGRQYGATNARIALLMWGIKVFHGEETSQYDPTQWKVMIQEARELADSGTNDRQLDHGRGGPEFIASVCVRDHFAEMPVEDTEWCVNTLCDAVEAEADNWHQIARIQRSLMGGDRPAAYMLSGLIGKPLRDDLQKRVRTVMPLGILHPTEEVRTWAASGAARYLWSTDPALAIRCINVLAAEANSIQHFLAAEESRPFGERVEQVQLEANAGIFFQQHFYGDIPLDSYEDLDVTRWNGADANYRILTILFEAPEHPLAVRAFKRLGTVIVGWWENEEHRTDSHSQQVSMDTEVALTTLFERCLLRAPSHHCQDLLQPVLDAMEDHPIEVSRVLRGMISWEDEIQNTGQFWSLWESFVNQMKRTSWLAGVDRDHSSGESMLAVVFLTHYWKKDVRHWRSLEGYAFRVHALLDELPPSISVFDNYIAFLYHIGDQSLPKAFELVSKYLRAGIPVGFLKKSNTAYMLEVLLRRFVYGQPLQLKRDRILREAVLHILDSLVDSGSSSAYRMRDDFVTPIH